MKLDYPATHRNRDAILGVLHKELPSAARVLEVASGSGQHATFFAGALPGITWQPSSIDDDELASIEAWREECGARGLLAPVRLDARESAWPAGPYDALFCANMVHIAPWSAAEGLFAGAARVLRPGGVVLLYGPFRFSGRFLAASNEAFDASLRDRDPGWGVRDVEDLVALADRVGLAHVRTHEMPANNHVLVFVRPGPSVRP